MVATTTLYKLTVIVFVFFFKLCTCGTRTTKAELRKYHSGPPLSHRYEDALLTILKIHDEIVITEEVLGNYGKAASIEELHIDDKNKNTEIYSENNELSDPVVIFNEPTLAGKEFNNAEVSTEKFDENYKRSDSVQKAPSAYDVDAFYSNYSNTNNSRGYHHGSTSKKTTNFLKDNLSQQIIDQKPNLNIYLNSSETVDENLRKNTTVLQEPPIERTTGTYICGDDLTIEIV